MRVDVIIIGIDAKFQIVEVIELLLIERRIVGHYLYL